MTSAAELRIIAARICYQFPMEAFQLVEIAAVMRRMERQLDQIAGDACEDELAKEAAGK